MDMIIRKTREADLDSIMSIIDITRKNFKDEGIPQWQGEYPARSDIQSDMDLGQSYVCEMDGVVSGVCAIVCGVEPDYHKIYEGEWKNDRDYVCMHRVALHPNAKGRGVAAAFVKKAEEIASSVGVCDLRCDTHEVNKSMRRMLEKNGFELCGVIYLSLDGEPRVAYQRCLDK